MYFTVYALLLVPVAVTAVAPGASRHLAPPAGVRALTCLAATAAASTAWGLAALSLAGLANFPPVRAHLHGEPRALAAADPVPWTVGATAGTLLALVTVRALLVTHGLARQRAAVAAVRHHPAAGDLVVLADDHADAYAVPGRPPRIVATSGMLRALDAGERAVLIAHERAHLVHRHHRYAAVADIAVAVNPLLGGLRAAITFGVERWADEAAAEAASSRALATRALARAALATAARTPGAPRALSYPRHRIAARITALQAERPRSRWHRAWPTAGLLLGASIALVDVGVACTRLLNAL
ncbi:M48 family metalloprotease [Kitasatospora sp. NPDC017646]|uniref:M48 family metalloprotease n=1 Tax=Kitasatospora sp. NPDC017646 TaxID=3364024 RepID=UPI0037913D02